MFDRIIFDYQSFLKAIRPSCLPEASACSQLAVVCPAEKDYIADLLDVIKTYDDLSDGELKYLANLTVKKSGADETVKELKEKIPVNYIIQIKRKVESIDAQTEIIMFTEDLRSDNA